MGYVTRFAVNQVGIVDAQTLNFEIQGVIIGIICYVKNVLIFSSKPSQAPIRS